MKRFLLPTLDDLRAEFVLMQAWKKTSAYLRQHSWYADTLEIDFQSLRVPHFLREIQERLESPESWIPSALEFVPAPKSQSWRLQDEKWKPCENIRKKIRPLSHLGLQDQVVATALLMCLADLVEQEFGDPLLAIEQIEDRRKVLAYGHRLFCDSTDGHLRHRWGSSKLFRLYYVDYQTFLRRSELVAVQEKAEAGNREIAIVQSDLSKFYDRVRPGLLHEKVRATLAEAADGEFFSFFQKVFNWQWKDGDRARQYANLHGIEGFEAVALPQGLAAAGFFANIALRDFDAAIREAFDKAIDAEGRFILKDACYYVDDLRLVLSAERGVEEAYIEASVQAWLQDLLDKRAAGLVVEPTKTKATVVDRQKRFLVPQSKTANRIQRDVSGVFDMIHGTELIGAIEGFFHTQKRYSSNSEQAPLGRSGLLVGVSDMRDDTAARFAAGRFRRTFRSLRPLLMSESLDDGPVNSAEDGEDESDVSAFRLVLSREQLDERGQFFAAMLIDEWVSNPGNVRLLRIALDLYPDAEFLERILALLRPGWKVEGGARGAQREVQQYCLAEIFRAGATETGMVSDDDCLPSGVSITDYHKRLTQEATDIVAACVALPAARKRFPWYLLQQVLLYLAVQNKIPAAITSGASGKGRGLFRYERFARFLNGTIRFGLEERAVFLILTHSSFGLHEAFQKVLDERISSRFLRCISEISPATAKDVWETLKTSPTIAQA